MRKTDTNGTNGVNEKACRVRAAQYWKKLFDISSLKEI